jgi:hypothetical protein
VGERALAREEEYIKDYYFLLNNKSKTIRFKGYYISIYKEEIRDMLIHISRKTLIIEFENYKVPEGYTICVRISTIYFTS